MGVQPIVFRSTIRNLMLSFPEEQHGLGKNAKGDPAPYRNTFFSEGMLAVNPEEQSGLLERIRNHTGLGADFWEESPEDTKASGAFFGDPTAVDPEGGLTEDDNLDLSMLGRCSVQIPPSSGTKALDALKRVMDRFNVQGIAKPTDDLSLKRLRARIIEVLGVLEDEGLWSIDDGRGDS